MHFQHSSKRKTIKFSWSIARAHSSAIAMAAHCSAIAMAAIGYRLTSAFHMVFAVSASSLLCTVQRQLPGQGQAKCANLFLWNSYQFQLLFNHANAARKIPNVFLIYFRDWSGPLRFAGFPQKKKKRKKLVLGLLLASESNGSWKKRFLTRTF